jgi:hypothetical protein
MLIAVPDRIVLRWMTLVEFMASIATSDTASTRAPCQASSF